MEIKTVYTVTIRAEVVKQISVLAVNHRDAERLAHGMFMLDDCDSKSVQQETLGSIVACHDLSSRKTAAKPWVVVDNPGEDDEKVAAEFATFELALKCKSKRRGSDIMKRSNFNSLTTMY
ncbi:hypothetical protein [Rhodoferax antarcticus]|uniref:Uncharacterized protein n=1 Tax=Rhodoferax antarcticus ANT.BR TaxID=1111071 RepID=A0A1Q8Y935_9BURK|nr:hypothetical protein [Rhodoferax antarcticus]OLP04494.1 hypothetical protein BLL52_4095 [Rhodoferax antarcticus ANT.BR]